MATAIFEQDGGFGQAATIEEWSKFVLSRLATKAVLFRAGVTVIPTMAKQVHVPIIGDAPVVWSDELDDLTADAPEGDDLVLTPKKVGTVVTLSNESATDESSGPVLNSTGDALVGAIARAMDAALLSADGTGKKPLGIYNIVGAPDSTGSTAVDRAGLVKAAGLVRAAGGDPRVAFISAADHTAMELATDGFDRPLLGDPTDGAPQRCAGLDLFPTPALSAGKAIVADPSCIVVALRQDPSVAFSSDAAFDLDGTKVRVTARADVGVRDLNGIALIKP
jgi:HK97 family phage major capsid protein